MGDRQTSKALRVRPASTNYEVGYGKPPEHGRFKPGQSGNPKGRPKGSRKKRSMPALNEERLKSIILEEAYRTISINDAKGAISVPMVQAIVRSLAVNAAKGNQRAQRLFTELLSATERENKRLHDEWLQAAIDYKFDWERELDRRNQLGIGGPEPIPHPDHVVINMKTGLVEIKGPMTKEEKAFWEKAEERKKDCDEEIREITKLLESDPENPILLRDLEHEHRIRALICRIIPD